MKFMMVIISIAVLPFLNSYASARKQGEVKSKKAVLPKHRMAA
jgi:hypothetical protein